MLKLIAALITSLLASACDRPPSVAEAPDPPRLTVTLGEQTARLGALRPMEEPLPFCEAGRVYEARSPTATLRVCVSDEDGPVAAHVSFRPHGEAAVAVAPTVTWYSGLLEPGTVQLVRGPDGVRLARVHGTAMLPVRYGVASFVDNLDPQPVTLLGEARLEG